MTSGDDFDPPEYMIGFGPKVEPKPKFHKPKPRRRVLWVRSAKQKTARKKKPSIMPLRGL